MGFHLTFAVRDRNWVGFCHSVFAIVVFAMLTNLCQFAAAGCYHQPVRQQVLDPNGNPLPENYRKAYDGGVFKYYKVPNETPCNGPTCKSVPSQSLSSEPALMAPERISVSLLAKESREIGDLLAIAQSLPTASLAVESPSIGGLLRPPTI